jgi:hypothetical protein
VADGAWLTAGALWARHPLFDSGKLSSLPPAIIGENNFVYIHFHHPMIFAQLQGV